MTPDGWRGGVLGDDAEILSGQHVLAGECTTEITPYPYLTGPADFPSGKIRVTKYVRAPRVLCEQGDILVTIKGSGTGKLALAEEPYCISRQLAAVRPRTWNSGFVLQLLSGRAATLRADASGLIPGLTREDLLGLPLLVPPLGEQRKIAAILSSVDDAIEVTRAVIDQLGVVRKAMMAELLTRGLPGRHTRFNQTEVGQVPESWEVVRLGDVCERMFVGIAQAATHAYVPSGGIPIIRTTNVRPNLLRADDILRINDGFADQMRSKSLRAGDVLSARTGYPGTSVVVPDQFDGAQCFTLLVSRPGPRLKSQFLCHVMNSGIGERIVQHGQAGGAQQNLNVGIFQEAMVGLPSVEEQETVCGAIDAAYERERSEEAQIRGLRALKSALMSVLLTGEVRVKPDEEAA
jgi:type I restriction enzyme S subunit